jgi:hypothetical protein
MATRSKTATSVVRVNRAPVLTLWAAVVAERLGHDPRTALTLGKAVAGMNAQSKGRSLGIYEERSGDDETPRARPRKATTVELLGRRVAVVRTKDGLRAVRDGKPESAGAIERYLESKLGDALPRVRAAMRALARSLPKAELAERAYALYEELRPAIPAGERGWGAKGSLDVAKLRRLARAPRGGS